MKQIMIHNVSVELEKKRIKNMYLRILPPDGRVHISAPMKMSEDEIIHFVEGKLEWIRYHQDKISRRPTHQQLQYMDGDSIFIWGRNYRLHLKEAISRGKIEVIGDEVILYCKKDSTSEQREKQMNQWYKKSLEAEIPFLIARYEQIIKVQSNSYNIRDMKTRWGTCNTRTKNICLNLQLAKKAPHCLEYVVVHELVHLLERSHNAVFKSYMDHFLPEWRKIKKELNGAE